MKKLIISLLIVYSLVMLTACPSQSSITTAAKASNQLAGLTINAIQTVKTGYETNLFTLAQKNSIAQKLSILSDGGKAFNNAVTTLLAATRTPTADQLATLSQLFDTSVITPFLAVLTEVGLIKNAPAVMAAIAVIRTTVLSIAAVFTGKTALILKQEGVMSLG